MPFEKDGLGDAPVAEWFGNLRSGHLSEIKRTVERVRADARARWRVTGHAPVTGEARGPTAVAVSQAGQQLLDRPQLGGWDLADHAL